jgi:hypothetical protein
MGVIKIYNLFITLNKSDTICRCTLSGHIFLRFWFHVHVQQQWGTEARGGDISVYCITSWYTF